MFAFCPAAAYGLLKKRSRLFSLNGNNAVLEFFLEGVPDVVERHLDSKKVKSLYLIAAGIKKLLILPVASVNEN